MRFLVDNRPPTGTELNHPEPHIAVARSAGSASVYRLFLGLTPQALCFRALRALRRSIKYMSRQKLNSGDGIALFTIVCAIPYPV